MNCSALGNAPLRRAGVLIGRRLAQRSAAGLRGAEKGLVLHALAVVMAQFAAPSEEDPPGRAVAGLGHVVLLADHASGERRLPCSARRVRGPVLLRSGQGRGMTAAFPEIRTAALAQLPADTRLDGKLVVWG
ncbi:hypothetical protein ABT187_44235 [Streptomyces sp. NPDC001817]|uniref:hypothetical protein n=1 Tax=Streptomyces sp. NPDC001817 TaxID=3154398 RepID=UPI003318EF7F